MNSEICFNLTKEQKIAVDTIVLAMKIALEVVGVAAVTFAIEDANCGLIDLMSRVAQDMYKQNGLLTQRCVEFGAAENAKELGKTLEEYVGELQRFAQKEYKV